MNSTNSSTGKVSATFTNAANISREERHYCACLFAWLLESPENCHDFIYGIDWNDSKAFECYSATDLVVTYECTLIRDWLYDIKRKKGGKSNDFIEGATYDVTKKKPDMAFFDKTTKTLILFEAKFEEGFEHKQIIETQKYGDLVKSNCEIEGYKVNTVVVVLIGLAYRLNSYLTNNPPADQGASRLPTIAWECIFRLIPENHPTKEALKAGLERQYRDHPRVRAWTKQKDFANIDEKGKVLCNPSGGAYPI